MPFLHNAWYATGWSEAVGADPFRITILGNPVAIFRAGDGVPVALGDICPHRFASLSQGKVVEDGIDGGIDPASKKRRAS